MPSPGRGIGVLVGLAVSIVAAPSGAGAGPPVEVRFLHAVAGAGPADLVVRENGGQTTIGGTFANPSGYERAGAGRARLLLEVRGKHGAAASSSLTFKPGRWTVVAVARGAKPTLFVYRDDGSTSGKARLRAVHAAAEVGRADVRVDGRKVAQVGLGDATGYSTLSPGRYDLAVTRPGGAGGALVSAPRTSLPAGSTSTAVVVGSGGMPAKFVLLSDNTTGPSAAPATGFGGGGGGGDGWLLVVAAGLAGGALGGTAHLLLSRRARRAR